MTRLLVTGATGFVGAACLRQLSGQWPDVHACARHRPTALPPGVVFHAVDLLDAEAAARLVRHVRASHLLHLAWITTPRVYWDAPENDAWLDVSKRLLSEFAESGGTRVVVAGTCAEYDWTRPGPYNESTSATAPTARYGRAKDALRAWCEDYSVRSDVSSAWCRLFFVFGPGEHPTRFVPSVLRDLSTGAAPGDLEPGRRDFIHVDDAAAAMLAVLADAIRGPVNVGYGSGLSRAEFADRIARLLGRHDLDLSERADERGRDVIADIDRLRREVGWTSAFSLDAAIARAVESWTSRV